MSLVNTPEWGVFLWLVLVWAWVIWSLPSIGLDGRAHTFLISISQVSIFKSSAYDIELQRITLYLLRLHFFNRKNDQFNSKPRESVQVDAPHYGLL